MDLSTIHPLLANSYTAFLVIVLAWFVIVKLLTRIGKGIALRFSKKTKNHFDDIILSELSNPFTLIIFLGGVYSALPILPLAGTQAETAQRIVESGILFLVVFIGARFLNVVIGIWGKKFVNNTASRADDALLRMFRRSISSIGVILAFLMVLELWGIQVGPLIASLGIAGVAVAFALQTTLGNVFGGLSLLLDNTYAVGDWVEIAGISGVVEDVGIRSTKIKTWDNEMITVPNGKAADDIIRNYTQPDNMIRCNVKFGVAYGSDIEKVQKVVLKAIDSAVPTKLDDPAPYVLFTEFGDSSLNFVARFWLPDIHERLMTQQTAAIAIYKALAKAKIGIPFPQMDLHVKELPKRR